MAEYLGIMAMVLGSSLLIVWPLVKGGGPAGRSISTADQDIGQLNARKESIYEAIKEIEFDLAMGKLSQEDFEKMKAQYMHDAIDYLKKMDQFRTIDDESSDPPGESPDEQIEQEISSLKGRLKSVKRRFCNQCGIQIDPRDRFCTNCGARVVRS